MNEMIMFSILVPVYNVMDYVDDCIRSVLSQSYINYELILVDDGSEDESGFICDSYAERYTHIHVYHKSNQGLIPTRRFAIEHASGDYFVMLDSDDMLEKDCLEVLYRNIKKYNCDCVFYNRKKLIDGKTIATNYHIKEEYLMEKSEIIRKALIDIPYNSFCLKCAKSNMYTKMDFTQYYGISKGEDALQSLELLSNCNTAVFIDNELYIYRIRAGSICNPINQTDYEVNLTVRKKCLQFVREQNCFNENDMNRYRDKYIAFYIDKIILVGSLNIPKEKKKDILRRLRNEEYYTDFLSEGITEKKAIGAKRIIWYLFEHEYDNLLLRIILAYRFFRH